MNKERRKVQKIKGGSFIISLPSDWIEKNKVEPKEELTVIEDADGNLRISKRKGVPSSSVEIEGLGVEEIKYLVQAYYLMGSTLIEVRSTDLIMPDVKKKIKELQMDLPGLELIEERPYSITFKAPIINEREFNQVLNYLISSMSSIILEIMEGEKDIRFILDARERGEELYKKYKYLVRALALGAVYPEGTNLNLTVKDMMVMAVVVRDLGRILTHLISLSIEMEGINKLENNISKALELVHSMFNISTSSLFQINVKMMRKLREAMEDIRRLEEEEIVRGRINEVNLMREIRRIASYCIGIMDSAINKSIKISFT